MIKFNYLLINNWPLIFFNIISMNFSHLNIIFISKSKNLIPIKKRIIYKYMTNLKWSSLNHFVCFGIKFVTIRSVFNIDITPSKNYQLTFIYLYSWAHFRRLPFIRLFKSYFFPFVLHHRIFFNYFSYWILIVCSTSK